MERTINKLGAFPSVPPGGITPELWEAQWDLIRTEFNKTQDNLKVLYEFMQNFTDPGSAELIQVQSVITSDIVSLAIAMEELYAAAKQGTLVNEIEAQRYDAAPTSAAVFEAMTNMQQNISDLRDSLENYRKSGAASIKLRKKKRGATTLEAALDAIDSAMLDQSSITEVITNSSDTVPSNAAVQEALDKQSELFQTTIDIVDKLTQSTLVSVNGLIEASQQDFVTSDVLNKAIENFVPASVLTNFATTNELMTLEEVQEVVNETPGAVPPGGLVDEVLTKLGTDDFEYGWQRVQTTWGITTYGVDVELKHWTKVGMYYYTTVTINGLYPNGQMHTYSPRDEFRAIAAAAEVWMHTVVSDNTAVFQATRIPAMDITMQVFQAELRNWSSVIQGAQHVLVSLPQANWVEDSGAFYQTYELPGVLSEGFVHRYSATDSSRLIMRESDIWMGTVTEDGMLIFYAATHPNQDVPVHVIQIEMEELRWNT